MRRIKEHIMEYVEHEMVDLVIMGSVELSKVRGVIMSSCHDTIRAPVELSSVQASF